MDFKHRDDRRCAMGAADSFSPACCDGRAVLQGIELGLTCSASLLKQVQAPGRDELVGVRVGAGSRLLLTNDG